MNISNNKIDWLSNDLKNNNQQWTRYLSHDEKILLDQMILDQDSIFQSKAKLQTLFNDIIEATTNLFGFIIIKEFPKPDKKYSVDILRHFFLLFCKVIGTPLIQNKNKEYICDIKYTSTVEDNPNSRGPQINDSLPLHPDHGSLLGMYCVQSAENGGHTLLGNVKKIHDEIKSLRPDLLKTLYEPFYGDRRGHEPDGELPYDINPIFKSMNGDLLCQYVGFYYHDAQKKYNNIPRFTNQQINALDLFNTVSNDKKFILEIKLNPGDVIFINNNRVLHGRTKFEECSNEKNNRHLLRVWLSTPKLKSFPHYYGYTMPDLYY
jgi:hypothetical protein